jgi:hypothetical protein
MERRNDSFDVSDGARLDVRCESGSVVVRSGPAGRVSVDAAIHCPEACDYTVGFADGSVTVTARRKAHQRFLATLAACTWDPPRVDIVITAPVHTAQSVAAANASVDVEGFAAPVAIRTSNGGVRCADVTGDVEVSTSNGSVRIEDVRGPLVVRASNGSITGRNLAGSASIQSTNGRIDVEIDPPPGSNNSVHATNGSVSVGVRDPGSVDARVSTVHGRASVELPGTPGVANAARLDVRTVNGRVRVYAQSAGSTVA